MFNSKETLLSAEQSATEASRSANFALRFIESAEKFLSEKRESKALDVLYSAKMDAQLAMDQAVNASSKVKEILNPQECLGPELSSYLNALDNHRSYVVGDKWGMEESILLEDGRLVVSTFIDGVLSMKSFDSLEDWFCDCIEDCISHEFSSSAIESIFGRDALKTVLRSSKSDAVIKLLEESGVKEVLV